jgi:hypothetical protein
MEAATACNAEQEIHDRLSADLRSILQQRGYTVNTDLLERLNVGDDKQFGFEYEQLKTAYTGASKELYEKRLVTVEESKKFKVGVGPIANVFAAGSGADALVLRRYAGFDKSKGQKAKEVVATVLLAVLTGVVARSGSSGGSIEIALILQRSLDTLPAAPQPLLETAAVHAVSRQTETKIEPK